MSDSGAFARELADLFTGPLEHARGKLVVDDDGRPFVPAEDLLRTPELGEALDRFAEPYGEGDRRAVASLWSQWYLGTLVVPAVAAGLLLERVLPLGIEDVEVALDEDRRHPVAFRLPGGGTRDGEADAFERFAPLFRGHVGPLVSALADHAGLAARALWGNAGRYLQWTLEEIASLERGEGAAAAGRRLLDEPTSPDGRENPLHDTIGSVEEEGSTTTRRRVCCLRYLLPGVEGCADLCPLPEVRTSEADAR